MGLCDEGGTSVDYEVWWQTSGLYSVIHYILEYMECKEWTHIVYIQCYLDWELYKAKIMHHLAIGYSNAHKSSTKPSNLMWHWQFRKCTSIQCKHSIQSDSSENAPALGANTVYSVTQFRKCTSIGRKHSTQCDTVQKMHQHWTQTQYTVQKMHLDTNTVWHS